MNKIFTIPAPKTLPKLRLFCFPFAGGAASAFTSWVKELPDEIEVVLYQPRGRGPRFNEQPHQSMDCVIEELLQHLDFITSVPYIFFGHSLGSRTAYELAYRLKVSNRRLPSYLIASGSEPPHLQKNKARIDLLPDDEFVEELKSLNGTPTAVLENRELLSIFLPAIRGDFKLAFEYQGKATKMPFPILVLNGDNDPNVCSQRCILWQELSEQSLRFKELKGEHFFINTSRTELLSILNETIEEVLVSLKHKLIVAS